MDIKSLEAQADEIWGEKKMTLSEMIVRIGKVFGDICRYERNAPKDLTTHTDDELKKEMGNLIFTTIRFCGELGYDPEECIQLAIECQKKGRQDLA